MPVWCRFEFSMNRIRDRPARFLASILGNVTCFHADFPRIEWQTANSAGLCCTSTEAMVIKRNMHPPKAEREWRPRIRTIHCPITRPTIILLSLSAKCVLFNVYLYVRFALRLKVSFDFSKSRIFKNTIPNYSQNPADNSWFNLFESFIWIICTCRRCKKREKINIICKK